MSGRMCADMEIAIKLVRDGMPGYVAARQMGLSTSAVYRAMKRLGVAGVRCNIPDAGGNAISPFTIVNDKF